MGWNLLLILLITAEYGSFFYTIYRREVRTEFGRREAGLAGLCAALVVIVLFWDHPLSFIERSSFLIAFLAVRILFDSPLRKDIPLFFISFFMLSLPTSTENFLARIYRGDICDRWELFFHVLSILAMWLFYGLFGRKLSRSAFAPEGRLWIPMLVLSGTITALITNYQYLLYQEAELVQEGRARYLLASLAGAGGILIFLTYFVLLYFANENRSFQMRLSMSEAYQEQQRIYFENLLEKDVQTRKLRHDYIADLVVLESYLERENYEDMKKYLSQMQVEIQRVSGNRWSVGNDIIDIILNYYLYPLDLGVDVMVLGTVGRELPISERDLTVLISNLVRNAVEELDRGTCEGKMIRFECWERDGEIAFRTRNTAESKKSNSGKGEGHGGFGLIHIREVAERYGGSFYWRIRDHIFETEIRIPDVPFIPKTNHSSYSDGTLSGGVVQ